MNKYIVLFCVTITTITSAMNKEDNHIPQSYAITIADKAPVTRKNCLETLNLASYIKETTDKILFIDQNHQCMSYDKNGDTKLRYFDNKVKKHIDGYKIIAYAINSSQYDVEKKKLDYAIIETIQYFAYSPFKVHYIMTPSKSENSDLSPIFYQIDDIYEKADKYKNKQNKPSLKKNFFRTVLAKLYNRNFNGIGKDIHDVYMKIRRKMPLSYSIASLSKAIDDPSFPLPEWREAIQALLFLCCIFI